MPQHADELSLVALNQVLRPDVAMLAKFRVARPDEISLEPCPQPGEHSSLPSKVVRGQGLGLSGAGLCAAGTRRKSGKQEVGWCWGGQMSAGCKQGTGSGRARVAAASAASVMGWKGPGGGYSVVARLKFAEVVQALA